MRMEMFGQFVSQPANSHFREVPLPSWHSSNNSLFFLKKFPHFLRMVPFGQYRYYLIPENRVSRIPNNSLHTLISFHVNLNQPQAYPELVFSFQKLSLSLQQIYPLAHIRHVSSSVQIPDEQTKVVPLAFNLLWNIWHNIFFSRPYQRRQNFRSKCESNLWKLYDLWMDWAILFDFSRIAGS